MADTSEGGTVDALRAELVELRGSMAYAWAMGHGCSIGPLPQLEHVRCRETDLVALIGEMPDEGAP